MSCKFNIPNQKLAHLTFWGSGSMDVFWDETAREPVFHLTDVLQNGVVIADKTTDMWIVMKDGNIMESLAYFLTCEAHNIVVKDLFLYEDQSMRSGNPANNSEKQDIYDCDWSDFACEKMILSMDVRNCPYLHTKQERLAWAMGLEDDTYDDGFITEILDESVDDFREKPVKSMCACANPIRRLYSDYTGRAMLDTHCLNEECQYEIDPCVYGEELEKWEKKVQYCIETGCNCSYFQLGPTLPYQDEDGAVRCAMCDVEFCIDASETD